MQSAKHNQCTYSGPLIRLFALIIEDPQVITPPWGTYSLEIVVGVTTTQLPARSLGFHYFHLLDAINCIQSHFKGKSLFYQAYFTNKYWLLKQQEQYKDLEDASEFRIHLIPFFLNELWYILAVMLYFILFYEAQ